MSASRGGGLTLFANWRRKKGNSRRGRLRAKDPKKKKKKKRQQV